MTTIGVTVRQPAYDMTPACVGFDPEWWFPSGIREAGKALEICEQCPLIEWCYQTATAHSEGWGVWGGVIFGTSHGRVTAAARAAKWEEVQRRVLHRTPHQQVA